MRQEGHTLLELIVALGILAVLAAIATPRLKAYSERARLEGAAREFQGRFREARSIAVMRNVQTAMRFEVRDGAVFYSLFSDGNNNGVLSRDIKRGVDVRLRGPYLLNANVPGVRVAINPGVPEPPPGTGMLDTSDPVRFGRSEMLSFSPMGTATTGTFFLATPSFQAAVRVVGTTARVRFLLYGGGKWLEP